MNQKTSVDRGCFCKYYEETLNKMKEDQQKQIQILISNHETELLEIKA